MKIWILLFALAVVAETSAQPPVFTIKSQDGDIVDCINIKDQPAFDHPILRNHTIQEIPAYLPNIMKDDDFGWQIWHRSGLRCPEGTIPIRRRNGTTDSQPGVEAILGHEYAIGILDGRPSKVYGTRFTMNVWNPKIEQANEFSLAQVWITSGSYDNNTLNTSRQVYPDLYKDHQPRLFIFWTTDAYTGTKCYNLRCAGFVQTSRTVLIEGAISPASTIGGPQFELTIQIWKDPAAGPWWLGVGFSNGTGLSPVGYWPVEIFTRLSDHAESIHWGGEIVDNMPLGRHTSTEMGSGYRPGSDKAAYMRDLQVAVNPREFRPVSRLVVGATNASYYSVEKYSNTSFAYGGPAHGAAAPAMFSSFVFYYSCFFSLCVFVMSV